MFTWTNTVLVMTANK